MRFHARHWWYQVHRNWNGICNSSVASAFLLLEPDLERVSRALEIAPAGLLNFVEFGFEQDRTSTEGVSYWHYGLINFVALSAILRAHTERDQLGCLGLLACDRRVSCPDAPILARFACFADGDDALSFETGMLVRLREDTGGESLVSFRHPQSQPNATGD